MCERDRKIGEWRVCPASGTLTRGGETRRLSPKAMAVLAVLAAAPGCVVPRRQLLEEVWAGRAMSDEPLNRCIADLRALLDDDRDSPRYIETLPRRGYRLVATVRSCRRRRRAAVAAGAALVGLIGLPFAAIAWLLPHGHAPDPPPASVDFPVLPTRPPISLTPQLIALRHQRVVQLARHGYMREAREELRWLATHQPSGANFGWLAGAEFVTGNIAEAERMAELARSLGWREAVDLEYELALYHGARDEAIALAPAAFAVLGNVAAEDARLFTEAVFDAALRERALARLAELSSPPEPLPAMLQYRQLMLLGRVDDAIDVILGADVSEPPNDCLPYYLWFPGPLSPRGHPRFGELVAHFELAPLWEQRGPNDFCARNGDGTWVCR